MHRFPGIEVEFDHGGAPIVWSAPSFRVMKLRTTNVRCGNDAVRSSDSQISYNLTADYSTMEGFAHASNGRESWLLTFKLHPNIALSEMAINKTAPREIRAEAAHRLKAMLCERTAIDAEAWRGLSGRAARRRLGVKPRKPGPPSISPIVWAHRACIAAASPGEPAADLETIFEADSRRTAEEWLRRMTGAHRPIRDLDGEIVQFLRWSGTQRRPIYEATPIAKLLAGQPLE